jgi:hypothetical protein
MSTGCWVGHQLLYASNQCSANVRALLGAEREHLRRDLENGFLPAPVGILRLESVEEFLARRLHVQDQVELPHEVAFRDDTYRRSGHPLSPLTD